MPTTSTTHFAILGLLSIRPMSAYELVKFSNDTIGFFWNESYGNIYGKLKELEESGYIDLIQEIQKGRRKKIYGINARGKRYLKEWLKQPTEEINIRDELLLKIFVSEKEDLDAANAALAQETKEMTAALKMFTSLQQTITTLNQDPVRKELWLLTLDYGINYAQTRLEWCQAAHKKMIRFERKQSNE